MAKPDLLRKQWKIHQMMVNLPSLGKVFSVRLFCQLSCFHCWSLYSSFAAQKPFSAHCLVTIKALAPCIEATLQAFFSNRLSCVIHSPCGTSLDFHVISQNHRQAEVGWHLWRPSSPIPSSKQHELEKAAQDSKF